MAGTGDTLAFPDGSDDTISEPAADASSLMTLARLYERYEDTSVPGKRGQRAAMGLVARVGRRKS